MRDWQLVHSEHDAATGITYELAIVLDDSEVRGNALASGDAAVDKRYEDRILRRLREDDTWAWATARCRAVKNGVEGFDYLGSCCYADTAEFIEPGGYWDDMKNAAKLDLVKKLPDLAKPPIQRRRKK